jgi:TnpA family transposase
MEYGVILVHLSMDNARCKFVCFNKILSFKPLQEIIRCSEDISLGDTYVDVHLRTLSPFANFKYQADQMEQHDFSSETGCMHAPDC